MHPALPRSREPVYTRRKDEAERAVALLEPNPAGDRVKIAMSGKFLPYKRF